MEVDANVDPFDDPSAGSGRRLCCCCFPFSSPWERIQAPAPAEGGDERRRWWSRAGLRALMMKGREWSELVAGPRWKTFLRRFGRNPNRGRAAGGLARFQYDPLSYALNFDEGQGGDSPEEGYDDHRDFSARFAAPAPAPPPRAASGR
ncbi:hypothetical protein C4D60_Mb07t07310 [Musa balbisiana]|uniref:NHL repeat-containing protein n=1 Tax=Musa balbisiana TaxID=52838 RepID=A0A4S8JDK8_MUSBA|nr:hypothetical protein C4D60_Mb07t07310 [Musa balbisiana]